MDAAAKVTSKGQVTVPKAVREALMGITHMTQKGLSQAIPPAYTHWIGTHVKEMHV